MPAWQHPETDATSLDDDDDDDDDVDDDDDDDDGDDDDTDDDADDVDDDEDAGGSDADDDEQANDDVWTGRVHWSDRPGEISQLQERDQGRSKSGIDRAISSILLMMMITVRKSITLREKWEGKKIIFWMAEKKI